MAKTIGIDLGHDELVHGRARGRRADRHPERRGRAHDAVRRRVHEGRPAARRRARASASRSRTRQNTIFSIKRFMGRKFDEVSEEMKIVPYEVVKGPNGDVRVEGGGQGVRPAGDQRDDPPEAEGGRGGVPRRAGRRRGHHRPRLLQQRAARGDEGRRQDRRPQRPPHHQRADRGRRSRTGSTRRHDQTILVFDLGGGTFDVSVLELGEGVFEVKATNGDNHLGGDNFDKAIVDWMVAEFKKDQGIDLAQDKMALQRLYEAAEKAKIELSSTMTTQINLPFITATPEGPKHLDLQLTRAKLEELTADLLERTVGPTKQALADAGLDASKHRPRRPRRRHDPHAGRRRRRSRS